MTQNPKYDGDVVNLGYLNKRLESEETSNDEKISKLPSNYSSPPIPPYYVNSLLLQNGRIYRCIKSRLQGSFSMSDWQLIADVDEIDNAIKVMYDINKLEYVDQLDEVIETHFQETDPSLEWGTDLEKSYHVSDLWTKDNLAQYQYIKLATNPVSYKWQKVSVPSSLFDEIEGHKNLFLQEPTNYSINDLWIGATTKIAIKTATAFNQEDWVERDDVINGSKIEQEEYHKVYFLPKITEIDRYTTSEIKKAIDEISLTVSETYSTKTEVEKYVDDINQGVADTYTTKEEFTGKFNVTSNQIESLVTKTTEQGDSISAVSQQVDNLNINLSTLSGTVTDMNFNFNTQNLEISSSNSENITRVNNNGVQIFNREKLVAIFNNNGGGIEELIITGSAQMGYTKIEKGKKTHWFNPNFPTEYRNVNITNIFYLESNIQSLDDLVGGGS